MDDKEDSSKKLHDKEALSKQLVDLVHDMEQEGLLDKHFAINHSLKDSVDPFYFAELIPTFCTDAQEVLKDFAEEMDKPFLNYSILDEYCIKAQGSSSCFGAHRMALAIGNLRLAVAKQSKEECFIALHGAKQEFLNLQEKLNAVLQLERKIILL